MEVEYTKTDNEIILDDQFPSQSSRRAVIPLFAKEVVERSCCLAGLIILGLPLALIAIAVRINSPGPVIFVQPRFGKDGKPFGTFKFRTMRNDTTDISGGRQTEDCDPRITRVGAFLRRTSVDELPQLANVLLGHMALVGPRAHPCGMRVYGTLCAELIDDYHLRHSVKPGITGLAQISGSRGAVESKAALQRRLDLDLEYIRNHSLRLDAWIVWRTIVDLVSGKAAG